MAGAENSEGGEQLTAPNCASTDSGETELLAVSAATTGPLRRNSSSASGRTMHMICRGCARPQGRSQRPETVRPVPPGLAGPHHGLAAGRASHTGYAAIVTIHPWFGWNLFRSLQQSRRRNCVAATNEDKGRGTGATTSTPLDDDEQRAPAESWKNWVLERSHCSADG